MGLAARINQGARLGGRGASRYSPVGVHVRAGRVYAVQYQSESARTRLFRVGSEAIPADESTASPLADALFRLFAHHGFEGRRVVSALMPADVEVRPLRLPQGVAPDDSPAFAQVLLAEARSCLLYDPREAVLDYLPLPHSSEERDERRAVLLVASRRERVNRHLDAFRAAGLRCQYLEIAPCAVARVYRDTESLYAIIELEEDQTVISIARGPLVSFSRIIKFGMKQIIAVLERELGAPGALVRRLLRLYGFTEGDHPPLDLDLVSGTGQVNSAAIAGKLFEICSRDLEQCVREVQRTFDYFALLPGGARVEQAVLTGDGVPANFTRLLEARLRLPCSLGNARAPQEVTPGERNGHNGPKVDGPEWVVAAGLAQRKD